MRQRAGMPMASATFLQHQEQGEVYGISGALSGTSNIPFYPLCISWGVPLVSLLLAGALGLPHKVWSLFFGVFI